MKKPAKHRSVHNHTKPLVVAIGITCTFLALIVIYIACVKGGSGTRLRAVGQGTEQCYSAFVKAYANGAPVYACVSGCVLHETQCCMQLSQVMP